MIFWDHVVLCGDSSNINLFFVRGLSRPHHLCENLAIIKFIFVRDHMRSYHFIWEFSRYWFYFYLWSLETTSVCGNLANFLFFYIHGHFKPHHICMGKLTSYCAYVSTYTSGLVHFISLSTIHFQLYAVDASIFVSIGFICFIAYIIQLQNLRGFLKTEQNLLVITAYLLALVAS